MVQMLDALNQYKDVKKEITRIEEQIANLESRLNSPRIPILTDMPSGPHNTTQLEDGVIKLMQLKEKYEKLLGNLCEQQLAVEDMIEDLDPIERDLIRCRYFNGLKWEEVQKEVGYASRQTRRIHDRAIEKLESKE